jgi:hypothetical protein
MVYCQTRARLARAMNGENLRKFTETRALAPLARHAAILCCPEVQYAYAVLMYYY